MSNRFKNNRCVTVTVIDILVLKRFFFKLWCFLISKVTQHGLCISLKVRDFIEV